MTTKTVLSERLVKSRAAYLQKSLAEVNKESGLGNGYIYRLWNSEKVMLDTINRIAGALDCKASDLLEDVEIADPDDAEDDALATHADKIIAGARSGKVKRHSEAEVEAKLIAAGLLDG